jgi:hypothetical protein
MSVRSFVKTHQSPEADVVAGVPTHPTPFSVVNMVKKFSCE